MQFAEKSRKYQEYLNNKVNPILEALTRELIRQQPENVHDFIINFVKKHKEDPNSVVTPSPLVTVKNSSPTKPTQNASPSSHLPQTTENQDHKQHNDESFENGDEEEADLLTISAIQEKKSTQRGAVSAEAHGKFNPKGEFKPKVTPKTAEQRNKINERLNKTFMFASLDAKEQEIVVDAMEERKVEAGEWVIKQGEEGDYLYVIDHGTLECYKQFNGPTSDPQRVRTYNPGESFGELALLYNAPRAASIKAVTEVILFALDRDTFNHIVKDAVMNRRKRFEAIVTKIELLASMDPYERAKIADVVKPVQYKEGEMVIRQGDPGDKFYFIEEGTAVATKTLSGRSEGEVVYNYSPGDYFGELALLKSEPRAANVIAKTNLSLLSLDKVVFDRLLGPLVEILKRNEKRYEKFM